MIKPIVSGLLAAAAVFATSGAAQAQDRYYETWRGQRDVPGDFRCDAYWDRGRTDCNAAWRDQRSGSQRRGDGYAYRSGHRWTGHGGYRYGHDRWRNSGDGVTAYYGAYGRPDLVTGQSYGSGYGANRDPRRIDWCRWNYRSYDPRSGYYRAYSGRLVYCG